LPVNAELNMSSNKVICTTISDKLTSTPSDEYILRYSRLISPAYC